MADTDTSVSDGGGSATRSPGSPGAARGRESPFRTLGIAAGLSVLALVVPSVVLALLAVVAFALVPSNTAVVGAVMVFLQFAWFAGFALWYLRYRGFDRTAIRDYLGIETPRLRDFGLIILTWFLMLAVTAVVAGIITELLPTLLGIENAPEPAENPVADVIAENPEIVPAAVLFMFLVVGPAEETLFRGVVQNRLREQYSMVPAILLASALFAAAHVFALAGQDPTAIAMTVTILFVPSLGFGFIYEYTGNLVVPALLHGFHNSVIVLAVGASALTEMETEMGAETATLLSHAVGLLPV